MQLKAFYALAESMNLTIQSSRDFVDNTLMVSIDAHIAFSKGNENNQKEMYAGFETL